MPNPTPAVRRVTRYDTYEGAYVAFLSCIDPEKKYTAAEVVAALRAAEGEGE